jgi:hypothetical protein
MNLVDGESANDGDAKIYIAEWVDMSQSISSSFLKLNDGRWDEMQYTFDVTKCDKLFDVLVQGGMIKLKEGHVIPVAERGRY